MNIDNYLEFEKENNLFQYEINGFKYWHYIRFEIYNDIINQKYQVGQAHSNLNKEHFKKRIYLKLKQIPNWLFKNPFWNLKKQDVLVLNHHRRVKNGKFFDCIYTDDILKQIDYSYYVFEKPLLDKHFEPIRTEKMRYFDYLNFKTSFLIRICKRIFRFRLSQETQETIKILISNINKYFEVQLDENIMINLIEKKYLVYRTSKKYYSKILDKVQPKAIIEVVSYSGDRFIINELAKNRGIPVIELQHGTMGRYHIAYNFAEKIDLPTFPDYIFTFGQYWKDNTRLPIENDRVKVVGWPYFEKKVDEYKKRKKIHRSDTKKTILFISQGTIGKELSKIAADISKIIDKNSYRTIFKLHPGEYTRWKTEYPWLIDANLDVVDHNQNDMHYYFAQTDFQVGVASTALFEGIGYGLKTIIVKLPEYEYTEDLYNNSLAELAGNVEDIIRILSSDINCEEYSNIDYFWESNSMQKMISEIEKIIKQHKRQQ